jgi:hypothetical protein
MANAPSPKSWTGLSGKPLVRAAFDRLNPVKKRLRSHFLFEIDGQTIAYCYIRKNACSAFKRMLLDRAGYTGHWDDALQFLIQHYAAPSLAAAKAARWRVCVYRDPFDRAVSLFRNKLLMQEGDRDFLPDVEAVSGRDAANMTFEDFVRAYLAAEARDPHTRGQASHLLPMSYNCMPTLESLFEDMKPIVGDELAGRYFRNRANNSSGALFVEPSSRVQIRLLRERYVATGELPAVAALDDPELRSIIRRLYRDDYRLARDRGVA